MTKRLTEKQKEDIVKSFKSGNDIDALSQKYSCTNSTIIRNLKKNLGELKYKASRQKIMKQIEELTDSQFRMIAKLVDELLERDAATKGRSS